MRKKPWRALYRPNYDVNLRSKPFDTEDEAISWAASYVLETGGKANVYVYSKAHEDADPVPAEHRLILLDDRVAIQTWASVPRAVQDQQLRESLNRMSEALETGIKPAPGPGGPTWSYLEDQPLRVLNGR